MSVVLLLWIDVGGIVHAYANAEDISCYEFKKNGKKSTLGIPQALIPDKAERTGGSAFLLNLGVDLRGFIPASSTPNVDENLQNEDWSIEKYGYNPDLDIFSVPMDPEYLSDIRSGKLRELESNVPGFRRFEACGGCETDLYMPAHESDIQLMRCDLPAEEGGRLTGCIVDQRYGSLSLRYMVPYIVRQRADVVISRVLALMSQFETVGKAECH